MNPQRKWGGEQMLAKSDLVGQLISFEVIKYDDSAISRFGTAQSAVAAVTVLTGSRSGQSVERWRVMGAMVRQMADLPRGVRHCARVTSGTTKKGHTWYGIDLDVDQHDRALAAEYDRWAERLDEMEEDG